MTDKEIIQALGCCGLGSAERCKQCPLYELNGCRTELSKRTLNLIKRQEMSIDDLKAIIESKKYSESLIEEQINFLIGEVERLNALLKCKNKTIDGLDKSIDYAYNRGVIDFARKLRLLFPAANRDNADPTINFDFYLEIIEQTFDEMVGGKIK